MSSARPRKVLPSGLDDSAEIRAADAAERQSKGKPNVRATDLFQSVKSSPFSLRLAYHRPQANAHQIPFPGMEPIPVFVADQDFLQGDDFQSSEIMDTKAEPTIRFQLSAGAREKINYLAGLNQSALSIQEYIALLLFVNGEPAKCLTMVFEQLPDYQMDYRGLTEEEAHGIRHAIGPID